MGEQKSARQRTSRIFQGIPMIYILSFFFILLTIIVVALPIATALFVIWFVHEVSDILKDLKNLDDQFDHLQ